MVEGPGVGYEDGKFFFFFMSLLLSTEFYFTSIQQNKILSQGNCTGDRSTVQGTGALYRGQGHCTGDRGTVQGTGALYRGQGHCTRDRGTVQYSI